MEILPVMEHFYTIQGEGVHTGKAAYFVRLAGCDVGCVWCDVKESWDAEAHPKMSVNQIVSHVKNANANLVVITGGEPAMYELSTLTNELKHNQIRTHIETSAAHKITGDWDWVCISPKKFKFPLETELIKAHELKIIVFNKSDFEWAEQWAKLCNEDCHLLLQPEWEKQEEIMPLIIEYVKLNPKWKISLQTHKFIGVP